MGISVVIPTHNEAEAIGRMLRDIPSYVATEIIVVDSHSSDATPAIALIDIAADLKQLAAELEPVPEKAPRTAQWLLDWAGELERAPEKALRRKKWLMDSAIVGRD